MTLQTAALPEIQIRKIRGIPKLHFDRPHTYLAVGQRGTGKSTLIESIGLRYKKVIDLFGSRDCEALAWCRSGVTDRILFIVGNNAEVESSWDSVKVNDITIDKLKKYDVILTVPSFYKTLDEEYAAYDKIVKILYGRLYWRDKWYLLIREAANFIYSRIKITRDQNIAKADFIHTLREARHVGLAVGVDTIRWTSIDKELRDVTDYFFIKRVGVIGLPDELKFLYSYVDPYTLMKLPVNLFVITTNEGDIGFGKFDDVTWHKQEGENIIGKLGINIEWSAEEEKIDRGGPQGHVSDFEHTIIIQRHAPNGENLSMEKIAKEIRRSSRTVHKQIVLHNKTIKKHGECPRCMHVGSKYARIEL